MTSRITDPARVGTVAACLFAFAALASCGGDSTAPVVGIPAPLNCASTAGGGGGGYAVGSCGTTATNVFQPVQETVVVSGVDSYILALDFPPDLPQSLDEPGVAFLATDKALDDSRKLLGALRGQAYASPNVSATQPPYVALTDFHRSWSFLAPVSDPPAQELTRASYGTWAKFAVPGNPAEGYVGVWYGKRSDPVVPEWPTGADRTYAGYVVGVIGPDGSAGAGLDRLYGFSATLAVSVDGAGSISAGQMGALTISFVPPGQGVPTVESLPIDAIRFVQTGGAPPGALFGSLQGAAGAGVDLRTGEFEARYFGALADPGLEIAGRVRFTTANGLVAVAAFGAKRQ